MRYIRSYVRLHDGMVPEWMFDQIFRVIPGAAHEVVIVRNSPDGYQCLLLKRDDDDPFFAGKWHFPGTMIRSGDAVDPHSLWDRIANELGADVNELVQFPCSKSIANLFKNARQEAVSLAYIVEAPTGWECANGTWFLVDRMPLNSMLIEHIGIMSQMCLL